MRKFTEMLKEDGVYSLTRVLPTLGYIIFLLVSVALAVTGKEWRNYGEFAMATGGAVLVQLGNKWVNSRYNTPQGAPGKIIGGK
ncbi:MAG: hypothetical protein Q4E64_03670 [Phascolarctobacterium sp.]|uniref:hypothetical protein n=1 Tax=Phascolarctobacterium sp. TaxID=2049039 RepID=UPI0026DC359A|nr:hypothetical protein [Phascolarctobacterium sp.]MDO4920911.1 hypothetical protein [Phascolarctobacterium sp.]